MMQGYPMLFIETHHFPRINEVAVGVLIRPWMRNPLREGPVLLVDEGNHFPDVLALVRPPRTTALSEITEIEAKLAGFPTPFLALADYCDHRPGSDCDTPVSLLHFERL